jgi:hypothetical protein
MVLYHTNGRVIKVHENYLEQEARKLADSDWCHYTDQIEIVKARDPNAQEKEDMKVHIVVQKQRYQELYYNEDSNLRGEGAAYGRYDMSGASENIPEEGLDRKTLMMCSSLAEEFFTFCPTEEVLYLPVSYPRRHVHGLDYETFFKYWAGRIAPGAADQKKKYGTSREHHMAFIRQDEIRRYIVPWLKKMEDFVARQASKDAPKVSADQLHRIEIPVDLLEMIHLYNAMLQLGIATHFQRPLIDALVLKMYQTNLQRCHLDTLEMTVCRFYSKGIPILDPVLNHFIGTYAFRSAEDRRNSKAIDHLRWLDDEPPSDDDDEVDEEILPYLPKGTTRKWLEYSNVKPNRKHYPDDTVSLPPRLEVLGHSIRHWSGIRRSGSTAAAYTGFPLNIGDVRKYYRRLGTDPIRTVEKGVDFADEPTHRLKDKAAYWNNAPGDASDPILPMDEPEQNP